MKCRSAWIGALSIFLCWNAQSQLAAPESDWEPMLFPNHGPWGIVVHTPYHGQALKDLGVQWVRLTLRWDQIERGQRSTYEWTETDRLLQYYLDQGFMVMAILAAETLNPLYESDKDNKEIIIDAIARWAGAMAARFKDKGIVWELGNEPEVFPMNGYWNDPATYTQMARKAASAIKTGDPNSKVAALSVAWIDQDFIAKALADGLLVDWSIDAITYHGYHRRHLMPESGLTEDISWLREQLRKNTPEGKTVVPLDSERGYSIVPLLSAKKWDSWRNQTYSESEQAAYLARHYLETLSQGIEIAVWYKDMCGENAFSLFYGTEESPEGLRPMGRVYRNLAALLPENPKKLKNSQFPVSLTELQDQTATLPIRTFLKQGPDLQRLVIAVWNPVESFDERILENRKKIGDYFYEAWRAKSPEDLVDIAFRIHVKGIPEARFAGISRYNLLAKTLQETSSALEATANNDGILSQIITAGPTPTVIVVNIRP